MCAARWAVHPRSTSKSAAEELLFGKLNPRGALGKGGVKRQGSRAFTFEAPEQARISGKSLRCLRLEMAPANQITTLSSQPHRLRGIILFRAAARLRT